MFTFELIKLLIKKRVTTWYSQQKLHLGDSSHVRLIIFYAFCRNHWFDCIRWQNKIVDFGFVNVTKTLVAEEIHKHAIFVYTFNSWRPRRGIRLLRQNHRIYLEIAQFYEMCIRLTQNFRFFRLFTVETLQRTIVWAFIGHDAFNVFGCFSGVISMSRCLRPRVHLWIIFHLDFHWIFILFLNNFCLNWFRTGDSLIRPIFWCQNFRWFLCQDFICGILFCRFRFGSFAHFAAFRVLDVCSIRAPTQLYGVRHNVMYSWNTVPYHSTNHIAPFDFIRV